MVSLLSGPSTDAACPAPFAPAAMYAYVVVPMLSTVGYAKNFALYFAPLLLFIVPTFHVVIRVQRELRNGHHSRVLDLLEGSPLGLPLKGVPMIPLWMLFALLLFGVVVGYSGVNVSVRRTTS
jgi:hypothetical protein